MTDQRTNGETFTFRCIYCRETSVGGWDAKLPNDACWNKNTGKRHRWHNWKDITPVAR